MSFLANFLMENDIPISNLTNEIEKQEVIPKSDDLEGHLLIAGSTDWDNVNYGPRGLNELCRIDLSNSIVKNMYSSCSAHHLFIVVKDAAVKSGEALYAMGRNDFGQLGSGDNAMASVPRKISNPGVSGIKKIATGRYHSVLLTNSGELYGCGSTECGQLGLGTSSTEVSWKKIKTVLPVVDVSCGFQFTVFCDTAGHVYSFGHPEYGQLGHGTTGEHFQEGKRKLQYEFITKPKRLEEFVVKDAKQKITSRIKYDEIAIVSVSAGRNHVLCLEASAVSTGTVASSGSSKSSLSNKGRVFSWGFGGYGRLGHNGTQDELLPRMINTFDSMCNGGNLDKPIHRDCAVVQIVSGNTASVAVTKSGRLFLMGIVNNAANKECNMYPKEVPALMGSSRVDSVSLGVSCIYVLCEDELYAWGTSQSGVMGFADTKTAASPKELDLRGLEPLRVSCGYLHTCILVKDRPGVPKAQMKSGKSNNSSGSSSSGKGKRPSPFAVMVEPTVCKFDASSQLKSYFPPLDVLPALDPEVRKAKRQKKTKSDGAAAAADEVDDKSDEEENYSSEEEEEDDEEGDESSEDDDEDED